MSSNTSSNSSSNKALIASAVAFATGIATGASYKLFKNKDCKGDEKTRVSNEDAKCTYEVDVSVDKKNEQETEQWLKEHIQEMIKLPGFIGAQLSKRDSLEKPTVIFVLGGPGAGKGTQCAKIVEEFGYEHISAGDCLRAEKSSGSEYATLINNYIKEGAIVPVEITVKLLQKAMNKSDKNKFLIDGFPRNANNMDGWNHVIGDSVNLAFVLFLDCPEEVMEVRLLERGKSSGRADDNPESIKKRFDTYQQQTQPIIQHFAKLDKVRRVVADASVEEVFAKVREALEPLEKDEKAQWTVQYYLKDKEAVKEYLTVHAPKMRDQVKALDFKLDVSRKVLNHLEFTKA